MEKTKIIATVNNTKTAEELIKKGVDAIRLNMSYITQKDAEAIINKINEVNQKLNKNTAILIDLEGPRVKTGKFTNGKATLNTKDKIRIYTDDIKGDKTGFSVNYKGLINDLKYKDIIKLNKGSVELEVNEKGLDYVLCEVTKGGDVYDDDKIFFPNTKIKNKFLSKKDKEDIIFAHKMNVDYLTSSLIKSAEEVQKINDVLIELMDEHITLLAKIENKSAINNLDSIINSSDGIILDRGDLGIQMPIEEIPNIQKKVIKKCLEKEKLSIITAEFNSFYQALPNRAEVSDLANLVSSATDCIMLTSETSIGTNPVKTLGTIKKIINKAEEIPQITQKNKDTAIILCESASLCATKLNAKAIIVITNTGEIAEKLSKLKPVCPIIAVTDNEKTLKSLGLCYGVKPVRLKNLQEVLSKIIDVKQKDKIIIVHKNFIKIEEI